MKSRRAVNRGKEERGVWHEENSRYVQWKTSGAVRSVCPTVQFESSNLTDQAQFMSRRIIPKMSNNDYKMINNTMPALATLLAMVRFMVFLRDAERNPQCNRITEVRT